MYGRRVASTQSLIKPYQRQRSQQRVGARLRFDRCVPRDLVHRRALAEVLITDTAEVAEDEFLLGTQLPRAHSLWSDRRSPYHDPLITVEIARQACLALPQRYYSVPQGWHFISQRIDFTVASLESYADGNESPPEGILRARFSNKRKRDGMLTGLSLESEMTIDGELAASISGDLMFLPPVTYNEMRAAKRSRRPSGGVMPRIVPRTLAPALVGRFLESNVVLEDRASSDTPTGERRFTVVVDHNHPYFFDHGQDHVPGQLLVEAYRQAAVATASRERALAPAAAVLTGCQVAFADFAELDSPIECSAMLSDQLGERSFRVTLALHQLETVIGEARVDLSFLGAIDHTQLR